MLNESQPNGHHLRSFAEGVLNSTYVRERVRNPYDMPIAGLRAFAHETIAGQDFTPREILPEAVTPTLIFDLDDTVWRHVPHVVKAVSEATGIHVTMEEFDKWGHTRKIPAWKDNPQAMEIHDQIQRGEHPDYFPFVNPAMEHAVETIEAVQLMGHEYSFLTARSPHLFKQTLRALQWNDIPHNHNNYELVDARLHALPQKGLLYCANTGLTHVNEYKVEVVRAWHQAMQSSGRNGRLIVIDDLLAPFVPLLEEGIIAGISMKGPLNNRLPVFANECRVDSWTQISEILMRVHEEALARDPSPYRLFDVGQVLPNTLLVVDKTESGMSTFSMGDVVHAGLVKTEEWSEDRRHVLERLGIR